MLVIAAAIGWATTAKSEDQESPVAVVKALYAAFDAGDMEKIKSLIAPDATWTYYGPEYALPFAGVRKGPAGVADFFVKVDDTLTDPGAGQREFIASGDQVAVPGTEESTVKETGEHYVVNNLHLWKVTNGKIVRFEEYIDSGAVLEAFMAADAQRGKAFFTTCSGCHGNRAQGRDEMFAPNLTGQHSEYLIKQLRSFRHGLRGKVEDPHGFQMRGRASALPSDRSARDVVAYIATLPAVSRAKEDVKAGRKQKGADLYAGCAGCHGAQAEGNAKSATPALGGLSAQYVLAQLNKYRSQMRGFDKRDEAGRSMASAVEPMSPSDLEAVTTYIASLRKN
ncbi:c-type cytochrome [Bradyrhizobium liaoningense]|uniref:c-type cytochrome n=1 Tax=Bradyrhizobium liaoningense TaxID=43992 RepID=UPI001BAB6048|nr:c-type cytochrome [Bradyrhizobium liaoningense]MBR0988033.1 c-type cytochrome [Bradyrhizobium liaoningense]